MAAEPVFRLNDLLPELRIKIFEYLFTEALCSQKVPWPLQINPNQDIFQFDTSPYYSTCTALFKVSSAFRIDAQASLTNIKKQIPQRGLKLLPQGFRASICLLNGTALVLLPAWPQNSTVVVEYCSLSFTQSRLKVILRCCPNIRKILAVSSFEQGPDIWYGMPTAARVSATCDDKNNVWKWRVLARLQEDFNDNWNGDGLVYTPQFRNAAGKRVRLSTTISVCFTAPSLKDNPSRLPTNPVIKAEVDIQTMTILRYRINIYDTSEDAARAYLNGEVLYDPVEDWVPATEVRAVDVWLPHGQRGLALYHVPTGRFRVLNGVPESVEWHVGRDKEEIREWIRRLRHDNRKVRYQVKCMRRAGQL